MAETQKTQKRTPALSLYTLFSRTHAKGRCARARARAALRIRSPCALLLLGAGNKKSQSRFKYSLSYDEKLGEPRVYLLTYNRELLSLFEQKVH